VDNVKRNLGVTLYLYSIKVGNVDATLGGWLKLFVIMANVGNLYPYLRGYFCIFHNVGVEIF
jgi:hypothetical protein